MTFQVYPEYDSPPESEPRMTWGKAGFLLVCLVGILAAASAVMLGQEPAASPHADLARVAMPSTLVTVSVNALANRHPISSYIYGANFPPSAAYIKSSGLTLSRWGGNSSSRYNWKANVTNLASDWYFENYNWNGSGLATSSTAFVGNVSAAGGSPLMTIPLLPWVAKDATSTSFSVKKYGRQCAFDPYRTDNGNGLLPDCSTSLTGNDPRDAHVALLDAPGASDAPGSVYRNQWIQAIASKFGTQPHFYDLDNEPDIWSGTHRDVHPEPTGYDELAAAIVKEGRAVKAYDPRAIRFGPVSCCWWFYWNGGDTNDKSSHAGMDFLPWLLNEIRSQDIAANTHSLDVLDVHAYFNGPSSSGMQPAQARAAALRETRDWWDATYVSESGTVNQNWATQTQPSKTVAFVIPRMRALANSVYTGMPVSFTEWNGALAGESDFSTALVDADAYGILGRERMWAASRWVAADPATPAYSALLLYRNVDSLHDGFQTLSVEATSSANPNLFSVYASTDLIGQTMTLMVINKDPVNAAKVNFDLAGFSPLKMKTYTLSSAKPTTIVPTAQTGWNSAQMFAPYSATLIVMSGALTESPAVEWDLNPDTLMAPASSTVTIAPEITSGKGTFTLTGATGSAGLGLTLDTAQTFCGVRPVW